MKVLITGASGYIGRSDGAEVRFKLAAPASGELRIFTTRPDTLFGCTYMVVAPEHPLVPALTVPAQRAAVEAYRKTTATKSDLERTDLAKEKTGVFCGSHAINPVNGARVPVWIADYVLMGYGTGAIMAVPAHDERDFEFCSKYGIAIRPVIRPVDGALEVNPKQAFTEDGIVENAGSWSGLASEEARRQMNAYAE